MSANLERGVQLDLVEHYVHRAAQTIADWLRDQPFVSRDRGIGRYQIADDTIWSPEIYHRVQAALDRLGAVGAKFGHSAAPCSADARDRVCAPISQSRLSNSPDVTLDGGSRIKSSGGIYAGPLARTCPRCGARMTVANAVAKLGPHLEVCSCKCPAGDEVETQVSQASAKVIAYHGPERRRANRAPTSPGHRTVAEMTWGQLASQPVR